MADAAAERHGQETFFVVGEGVIGTELGGRQPTLAADLEVNAPAFRFSRMGPKGTGKQLGEPNRLKIATAMTATGGTTGGMGAGFTYLGQFLDHETAHVRGLTFLIERVDAVVSDQRIRHRHDLPAIRRIGQNFLITGHRSVEANLTDACAGRAKRFPLEISAVFESYQGAHVTA